MSDVPDMKTIRKELAKLPAGQRRGLMALAQERCDEEFQNVPWIPRQWVEQMAWSILQKLKRGTR